LSGNSFHEELFYFVLGHLAQEGRLIRSHVTPQGGGLLEAEKQIPQVGCPSILTFAMGMEELPAARRLSQRGHPIVHLLPNLDLTPPGSIVSDDEALLRLQLEHLLGQGHRRIAYLHGSREGQYNRVRQARLNIFYRLAVEYRLDLPSGLIAFAGRSDADVRQATRHVVQEEDATALILHEDAIVRWVYAELAALGRRPGCDIAVAGTNDRSWCVHVDPPLSSVRQSMSDIAAAVLSALDHTEAGQVDELTRIPPRLIVRESSNFSR
jgi:LacI family transcriptional regulator